MAEPVRLQLADMVRFMVESFDKHPIPKERIDYDALEQIRAACRTYQSKPDEEMRAFLVGLLSYILACGEVEEGTAITHAFLSTDTGQKWMALYLEDPDRADVPEIGDDEDDI